MRCAPEDLDLPAVRADRADYHVRGRAPVVIERHHRIAEVGLVDVARAPQPTLLAHAEQKRDWRVIELLSRKLGRERDQSATSRAVVPAERGLRGVDDLAALDGGLRAGAERHRV